MAKVGKMISNVGQQGLKELGKNRKAFKEEIFGSLKAGRIYMLDPNKKLAPTG